MQDKVAINSACTMDWNEMKGSESTRHCQKCRFNVYNFAEMSQDEIDVLLNSGDRVCARLFLRPDGTYMTKDCRAKIKRNRFLMVASAAALLPFTLMFFTKGSENTTIDRVRSVPVIGSVVNFLYPVKAPTVVPVTIIQEELMGDICIIPEDELPVETPKSQLKD